MVTADAKRALQRLAAVVAALTIWAGCRNEVGLPEASLDAQIAEVRAARSDRIAIEARPASDADLMALADLTTLRILLLDHADNDLTDAGLANLSGLSQLVHLRIRGGQIGDRGVPALAGLSGLQILNLPQTQITDAGFGELCRLPNLEQLRIGSPNITDVGIERLRDFLSLRRLHLINVPVTDRGLRVFHDLPQLESLYLDGANISDQAYEALFVARPKLHVHINQQHHDRDPHGR